MTNANDTKTAIARIQAGERATLVVAPESLAEARAIFERLPARYRALLTVVARGSAEHLAAEDRS